MIVVLLMKLTGSYQINADKQKVWEALNDPEILKQAIPGCEEFKKNSDTEFTATATNKIGPFNASFTGDIELKDLNPPNSYKIIGSGNSLVGFASGEAEVKLETIDNGTRLDYAVEANVGGKIAQVGSRLIDITAKKMADIFFKKFTDIISAKPEIEKKEEKLTNNNFPRENNKNKRILIYLSAIIILASIIYSLSWITYR